MKDIAALFILCLWLSCSAACINTITLAEATPTATTKSPPLPTATMLPEATSNVEKTAELSDPRFISQTLPFHLAAIAAADFDNDGHQDLVGAAEPQLIIFRGDGQGGLADFERVPGGKQPNDFALTDLDGDGDVDIVVANHDTDYLTILLGDGRGAFAPASNSPLRIDVRPHPHAVRAADLDGDGYVELIVDHREGEGLLILRGLGDGRLETPGTLIVGSGDPYLGMAVGDLNGDGKLDLVTPNPGDVGVLLNTSDTEIAFTLAAPVSAESPFAVALGDFNGDGRLDLLTASGEGSPLVELFWGNGRGGFEEADGSPFHLAPGGKQMAVGDFNGDGLADAAVVSYQATDVLLLLGGRDAIQLDSLPGGEHPWGLAVADLNEDGKDDLVIADDAGPQTTVYLSINPGK
ncbi:MAG: VCBS repeat-containing protein [Anaerolineae bacterium]|nr:VCBS repeat-containing protein [Anaerolineae bacterium]